MKLALLHLSDIHITDSSNSILKRTDAIFDAVKNEITEVDEIFLIVTGDISYSGKENQFQVGANLLVSLSEKIKNYSKRKINILVIPGNHDCLFDSNKEKARELILRGLENDHYSKIDDSILDICTEPQNNFFSFIQLNNFNTADKVILDHKLLNILKFENDEYSIIFHCYNTSWDSRISEKIGFMSLPVELFPKNVFKENADLIIGLIHHPFNWQNPASGRDARIHLEETTDFVLSGHEHEKAKYLRQSNSNSTYYVEAGALQDNSNQNKSEFSLLQFDLKNMKYKLNNYEYKPISGRYTTDFGNGWEEYKRNDSLTKNEFEIKSDFFKSFLLDPGTGFKHGRVDKVYLSDIFVYPNLRRLYDVRETQPKTAEIFTDKNIISESADDDNKIILVGDNGAGKTTFCKYLFQKFYRSGYVPIYMQGNDINLKWSISTFKSKVYDTIADQYKNMPGEAASQIDISKLILIIDDFDEVKGSGDGRAKFIHNINKEFKNIVLTGRSQLFFEPITTNSKEFVDAYQGYLQLLVTEFGTDLRYKLVDKWNKLGREDELDLNNILRMNDDAMKKINSIIGKNFLPPYPIYLLTLLQAMESGTNSNPDYSLQGYYYDHLISDSMRNAISDRELISFYYNFVAEYSYDLFQKKIRTKPITQENFEKFFRNYSEKYQISFSSERVFQTLLKAKILAKNKDGNIIIAYNYIYYFFIAKYLNNRIHSDEIKNQIKEMCSKLYNEENSNVILFLVHLSNDPLVLDEILSLSKSLFADQPMCRLENDVDSVNGMIDAIPQQVIQLIGVEESRENENRHHSQIENEQKNKEIEVIEKNEDQDESPIDVIGKIFFAFKAIDILGQVTKKHWGDLLAQKKMELAEETYKLGLRTLTYYMRALTVNAPLLAEHIKSLIASKQIKERDKIDQFSKNFVFRLSFLTSFDVIKRISNSIGYAKLNLVFEQLLVKLKSTAVELVDLSIKLDHFEGFPIDDIKRIHDKTDRKNYLASLILRNLAINHIYLFETSIENRQRLENLLGIKISEIRLIDKTSNVKRD